MDCIRAYKFRIYPDSKRQKEIDEMLVLAQRLYNKMLEKAKEAYAKDSDSKINMSTLNRYMNKIIGEDKDFLKLYSQARQDIFVRLQRAFQNFFRRVKEKREGKRIKAGFPRFKPIDKYKSIKYPQNNGSFSIEKERKTDMLRVVRIGRMKIDLHREIEGKVKTLTIKREAGNYYAIFTTIVEIEPPIVKDTKSVGIDMGLNSFATTSDGGYKDKPKFMKKREKRIAHWQRKVSRRKKGSKRRERAKSKLQNEWEYTTNQSDDFAHKLSNKLVNSDYTSFAVEELDIQNMLKNHNLAQAIQYAAWGKFIQMLSYKAESAGMRVIKVDARDTTQECSNCHHIKTGNERLGLGDRIYHCNVCGMTMERDLNSAIVIHYRATPGHGSSKPPSVEGGGSNAQGDTTSAVQQEPKSRVEELRTYPAIAGEAPTFR